MVLEEVCEFVVEQKARLDVRWDPELDDALLLVRGVDNARISGVVEEGVCGGRNGLLRVGGAEVVLELIRGHLDKVEGAVRGRGGEVLAVGIVECEFRYEGRAPDEETANGGEYDTDDEEGGQYSLWGEDWLPCLEPLLLESGVYGIVSDKASS